MSVLKKLFYRIGKAELLSKSITSMMIKLLGMLSGYLFIFIALRISDIGHYGAFSITLAFIQLTALLGRLGFDLSVVKHIAVFTAEGFDKGRIREVYRKGLIMVIIGGTISSLVFYGLSGLLAEIVFQDLSLVSSFRTAVYSILPIAIIFYNAGALRGLKSINRYSFLINSGFLGAVLMLMFFLPFNFSNKLEWSLTVSSAFLCLVSFRWWKKESGVSSWRPTRVLRTGELLSVSLPMLSAGAINIINGWSDTLILGMLTSNDAVGIFQVLLKMAAIVNIILFSVNSISAPQFARLNAIGGREKLQKYVYSSTRLIFLAVVPLTILLLLGYIPVVRLLSGGFEPGDFYLAFFFLCFGQLFNSFCGSGGQLLIMTGHQQVNRNIIFVSFLMSISLNFILIPYYSILGAAFANMSGLVIRNLLYVYYTNVKLGINTVYNPIIDLNRIFYQKLIQKKYHEDN